MKFSFLLLTLVNALPAPALAETRERPGCAKESTSSNWSPKRTNTTQRLIWLRNEMNRAHAAKGPTLDAFIVSSYDEHQGEFVAKRDKKLEYISGFSGTVGFAVVTKAKAAFWTDPDYFEQAEEQLDCNWILMRLSEPGEPSPTEWLKGELKPGYRVGADPKSIPFETWEKWKEDLSTARIVLTETYNDLIDLTWTIGRPSYGAHSVFVLPTKYAGESWQNKVRKLREKLDRLGCDAAIVTALEEISWLLNVRGRDVPYNPFVRSYLIVTTSEVHWYVPKEKIEEPAVRKQLAMDSYGEYSVRSHRYDSFLYDARTFSQSWKKVLIPSSCAFSPGASQAVASAVPPDKRFFRPSPVMFMKAMKNQAELEGMEIANRRDSAALADFLSTLEEKIRNGSAETEARVSKNLEGHRLNQTLSQGIPYPTSVAFSEHGAFSRYVPSDETEVRIDGSSLLVMRGGGHYYDGTSDVARTFHFGSPTKEMRDDYTRLLSGFIKFSVGTFPGSVKTSEVDVILRSELWKYGMEYRHDTCHGIGVFSSAKESPIVMNYKNPSSKEQSLEEGYVLTCEPGFYKPGKYGIRLGNVMKVVSRSPIRNEKDMTYYLGFEQITLFPFERELIDFEKLTAQEIEWLNEYNLKTLKEIGAELEKQSKFKAFNWLKQKTKPAPLHNCRSSAPGVIFSAFSVATIFGSRILFLS